MAAIGAFFSGQVNRVKDVANQQQALARRLSASGQEFPGSGHRPADRKTWMAELGPERLRVHQVVWPGTHNSATAEIGVPFVTRPFAQCQSLSVYDQLATGCRLLDVRVQKDRRVCHGPLVASYTVDVVIDDVRRFLAETASEVLVLEVRTEFGHEDPPEFAKYLVERLGEHLIPQDDAVFRRTVAELLPRRVICVWKPRNSPAPARGGPLWGGGYLRDNWINTDLPEKKFDGNLASLGQQPDPAAPVPGGEHADAADRQPGAARRAGHAAHPPLRALLHRPGLRQGPRRQAAGVLHRLHRRRLRRRLRRRHQGPRRRRHVKITGVSCFMGL